MGRTVEELSQCISERELTEWVAYNRIQPFGEEAAYIRNAQLCALLANCHRDPKKRKPFEIEDFLLFPQKGVKKQTPEEAKAILMSIVQAQRKAKSK